MFLKNIFKKNRKMLLVIFVVAVIFISLFPTNKLKAQVCSSACNVTGCCTTSSGQPGQCTASDSGTFLCSRVDQKTGQVQKVNEYEGMNTTGGGLWDWLGNIAFKVVFKILYAVTYIIFYIFSLILRLAGALLDFVLTKAQFNQFAKSEIVKVGWDITKNLANMFFALILLIISFATILRIESYGIKQVLPRLIIAALLINFSLVIGGVIIDFTQVLTKYFVDAALQGTSGSLSATISQKLQITQGVLTTAQQSGTPALSESLDGLAAAVGGLFAGIIVILIAAFVFFAAALLFVVRYIALLFLLILAPLAWFFYIVPMTKKYWDMWWSTFFKWAFFAPAYAFFLYLSMVIIKSDVMGQVGVNAGPKVEGLGRYTLPMLINYTIMIGFLLGGLIVAQKIGVYGGGAMLGWVKSAGRGFGRATGRWAARGAPMPGVVAPVLRGLDRVTFRKLGLGKAATKYEAGKAAVAAGVKKVPYVGAAVGAAAAIRKTLPTLLVPAVWKRALAARRARAEGESFTTASGRLEGLLGFSIKEAEEKAKQAKDNEVAKKIDELKKTFQGDEDRMTQAFKGAKDPIEKEALIKLLASTNGLNTLLKNTSKFNPEELRKTIQSTFGDKEGARVAASIGGIGAANKNYSYFGMTRWDDKTQQYEFVKDDPSGTPGAKSANTKQAEAAANKAVSEEPQDWARGLRAESIVERNISGALTGKLTETGSEMIAKLTKAHIDHVNRMKTETLKAFVDAEADITAHAGTLSVAQQGVVSDFMTKVKEKYQG